MRISRGRAYLNVLVIVGREWSAIKQLFDSELYIYYTHLEHDMGRWAVICFGLRRYTGDMGFMRYPTIILFMDGNFGALGMGQRYQTDARSNRELGQRYMETPGDKSKLLFLLELGSGPSP